MVFIDDNTSSPLSKGNIATSLKFWIEDFLKQRKTKGASEKTLKSYKEALDAFEWFTKKHSDSNTMENIGAKYVNRFIVEYQALLARKKMDDNNMDEEIYIKVTKQEKKKKLGKNDADFYIHDDFRNTLLHRQTTVKMLLKYISDNNSDGHDYVVSFDGFATIKLKQNKAKYLTIDELDKVIDRMVKWDEVYKAYRPKQKMRYAYRDALMILLYALTGARSEEVVKIRLRDITEFSAKGRAYYKIKIVEAKGGKSREVSVEKDFIENYIKFFKAELPDDSYYLSSTYNHGRYMNKNHHQDNIRKFGNFVINHVMEIKNKTGLHLFRRAYATKKIIADKESLPIVARQLGNTVSVLEKYYFFYDPEVDIGENG